MADREQVIKGFECCHVMVHDLGPDKSSCGICPYKDVQTEEQIDLGGIECIAVLHDDALALLKEQEAKQVIKQTYHIMMNRDYENPVDVTRYEWLCPTCKSLLCRDIDMIDDNYHFCKVCGQEVKWDA